MTDTKAPDVIYILPHAVDPMQQWLSDVRRVGDMQYVPQSKLDEANEVHARKEADFLSEVEDLAKEITRLKEANAWRVIDERAKDGGSYLLGEFGKGYNTEPFVASWSNGNKHTGVKPGWYGHDCAPCPILVPTHYKPLQPVGEG